MIIESVDHQEWERLFPDCRYDSVYQDPRWLALIASVYPKLPIHRLVCKAEGEAQWLLPVVALKPLGKLRSMWISLPFGNYGGFVYPTSFAPDHMTAMLSPLRRLFDHEKCFALEIRELQKPEHDCICEDRYRRYVLQLPEGPDSLWETTLSGNARTSVRKARKMGVHILFDHPRPQQAFQAVYERNASFHGTPLHHPNWYPQLVERFGRESQIILALHEDLIIGGLILLYDRGACILHAAVTDPAYRKIPVTDALVWACLEHLVQTRQCHAFDFGRTRPEAGKHFFKRKWGGQEAPLYYSYLLKPGHHIPSIVPENPHFKLGIQAWRLLPRFVQRTIGPWFRIRIPT